MARYERLSRRTFITDLGRATLGIIVLGTAYACADDDDDPAATATAASSPAGSGDVSLGGWERVNLGIVSAYILVRGGESVLVDTGVEGKATDIGSALSDAGSSWGELGHLILTHKHPDHIGSAQAVIDAATNAVIYAGEQDISAIDLSRDITAVGDGDDVAGLQIIATPGHTPGHVGVYDATSRVFVAGDAMITENGAPAPPSAQFTEDMDEAMRSIAKVAALDIEIALVGHGDPLTSGTKAALTELANS